MTSVGSYEAKTHLPELLERVRQGERIVITRRGKAVAMLVPFSPKLGPNVRGVIEAFKTYSRQQGRTLGGAPIREMIDDGRRY
ncbi:MAG TPA: type II toxin-antitoxin system prevent-host-death family antitoxin [Pirellulales bacterium]|nr:type II toxin-antitoxin system prevent-host-death family antitoxin [Pirellulales bacterium]